jgi:hypothetical protein
MADPETTGFASSNLNSGSFNSETGEMRITFSRGRTYVWTDVSESEWIGLKSAFSPGNYLRDNFGPGEPE